MPIQHDTLDIPGLITRIPHYVSWTVKIGYLPEVGFLLKFAQTQPILSLQLCVGIRGRRVAKLRFLAMKIAPGHPRSASRRSGWQALV